MKHRKNFFFFTLTLSLSFLALSSFAFSTFRLFSVAFRPVLISSGRNLALSAVAGGAGTRALRRPRAEIQDAVVFPDQILIFLKHPPTASPVCVYTAPSRPNLRLPPLSVASPDRRHDLQMVRCPLPPRGLSPTLALPSTLPSPPTQIWDFLAYEALLDSADNTTLVFVKGLNLRPDRLADPSRFECVYGWDLSSPRFLLSSDALSAAQEVVRCKTPLILLKHPRKLTSIKVSVRPKGRHHLPSLTRPTPVPAPASASAKPHRMCVCTMVRNQARFLHEWVVYHAHIGVQRWFIYDNDSEDGIGAVVESLDAAGLNVTAHVWPWIKTQEAGFAHCALRARSSCHWVGFIDVDEFFYLPSGPHLTLHDVLRNHSDRPWVGELRSACLSFGPSGLRRAAPEGVTVGYTCRMAVPERHKSIVRPEALDPALVNVVHHFHLRDGYEYVNVDRGVMVINHYKYQAWEVFKEKFHRRVATYVADWQDDENAGSKDRAPGLGTKAIEPPDWSGRFCDVRDTGLRDWVLHTFMDPNTKLLPWQEAA